MTPQQEVGIATATSVYIHFPWCAKRCPYCDFATEAIDEQRIPHEDYADAVIREMEAARDRLSERTLTSIFVGGGTPSLWNSAALGRVLQVARALFPREAAELEITVECNPASFDERKAAELQAIGVGRVSIGVQSLSTQELSFLGRLHQAGEALQALTSARKHIPSVSADVMFGSTDRPAGDFLEDLKKLIDCGVDHLSAYALTIEPRTQFGALHRRGRLKIATEDQFCGAYHEAERFLEAEGFEHYEVSNYAKPGCGSRHNQHYWAGGDYAGFGSGAVGCLTSSPGKAVRHCNSAPGPSYVTGQAKRQEELLGAKELNGEAWMLGLRTQHGLDVEAAHRRSGIDPRLGRERSIAQKAEEGRLVFDGGHFRVPKAHWLYLDGIIADLF